MVHAKWSDCLVVHKGAMLHTLLQGRCHHCEVIKSDMPLARWELCLFRVTLKPPNDTEEGMKALESELIEWIAFLVFPI